MTPEQAQQQRQQALSNAAIGLGLLSSDELAPDHPRASGVLLDLQQRIRRIETSLAASEAARARAAGDGDDEARVQAVMQEMARAGMGRI